MNLVVQLACLLTSSLITRVTSGDNSDNDQESCICGKEHSQGRILGGKVVTTLKYPWLAAIYDASIDGQYCGGSLINERYILTAGHCLYNRTSKYVYAVIGEVNLKSPKESNKYEADKLILHPNYVDQEYINDIGLIRLSRKVTFGSVMTPICLPSPETTSFSRYFAAGWGDRKVNETEVIEEQMESDFHIKPFDKCNKYWKKTLNEEQQFCVGGIGRDTCTGDSGGPLMSPYKLSVHALGIISFGSVCGKTKYSVYTNITAYMNWIRENTPGELYCKPRDYQRQYDD